MAHLNPLGRNWGDLVNWDDLGKAYAGLTVGWTIILVSGIIWLVANRNLPFIRMRNLPLAITSTLFLHVYLVKILLAYTTNGHFLCSAEFWIMSTYLPFGIALFQANVLQLRSISVQQSKLLSRQSSATGYSHDEPRPRGMAGLWTRWCNLTEVQKSYFFIGTGMFIELVIAGALYGTSPVLQGDWTSFGNITYAKGQGKCRKSFQFIPSAFWQLFWTWIYGPYVLFQVKNIRDVHNWRLQTILSIIAGLPGSPLWLAALYSPAFKPVNKWFVPPMWLAPGIVVMQFVTVFFPIYELFEHRAAMQQDFYSDSEDGSFTSSDSTFSEKQKGHSSTTKLFQELAATGTTMEGRNIYRMASLEKALVINPTPLLHFAATRDFTAENIIFLMSVKEWKAAWASAPRYLGTDEVTEHARSQLYNMAVEIFLTSVHHQTAEIPLNLESSIVTQLDAIFAPNIPGGGSGKLIGEDSKVNPADTKHSIRPRLDVKTMPEQSRPVWDPKDFTNDSADAESGTHPPSISPISVASSEYEYFPRGAVNSRIHSAFGESVFDAAEASTKYMVLTNTWRRFVKEQQENFELDRMYD
ncbi:Hypothetical protein R9X50_00073500 [Acrodontium crateriforme]|uniref:RGS domain-containing protein n=1 Tax=Acrodontium crateriforme TaxID=150365 RepID=A0AAQ3M0T6_9PEZI|nr:Hypothetical protein R9X50_00073500 [Acrodontium crateriforme]